MKLNSHNTRTYRNANTKGYHKKDIFTLKFIGSEIAHLYRIIIIIKYS